MAKANEYAVDFSLADETRMMLVKTVLTYESAMRGLTLGQTIALLVEQAVDLGSYPEQVKSYLERIDEESRKRAAKRACGSAKLPRSA